MKLKELEAGKHAQRLGRAARCDPANRLDIPAELQPLKGFAEPKVGRLDDLGKKLCS